VKTNAANLLLCLTQTFQPQPIRHCKNQPRVKRGAKYLAGGFTAGSWCPGFAPTTQASSITSKPSKAAMFWIGRFKSP
jgi:hypothetical protein